MTSSALPPAELDFSPEALLSSFFTDLLAEPPSVFTPTEVSYGEVVVTVCEKEGGKASTLMADQFFSSGLVLAELIELGRIPTSGLNILELGAGSALPSFIAASLPSPPPRSVLVTDYPDPVILKNLERNVRRNESTVRGGCKLSWAGYEWGTDVGPLLDTLEGPQDGFDLILLADLLWLTTSLPQLLATLVHALSRTNPSAIIYFASGSYTSPSSIASFFAAAETEGFLWEAYEIGEEWEGGTKVRGLAEGGVEWRETCSVRKRGGRVKGWRMCWGREDGERA